MSAGVLTNAERERLRSWISEQLDRLVGASESSLVDVLLANSSEAEFDRRAHELLGASPPTLKFLQRLKARRNEFATLRFSRSVDTAAPPNAVAYRKSDAAVASGSAFSSANVQAQKRSRMREQRAAAHERARELSDTQAAVAAAVASADEADAEAAAHAIRHPGARCECQATRHALAGNCSACGRVVCAREAGDYCLFCGFWLNAHYAGALSDAERRAEIHKQKLLMFDRDSERRTRVFDDQADYFNTDNEAWLDPAELATRRKARADADAARQRQRNTLTVTFDFAGRQIVAQTDDANRAALDQRFGVEQKPDIAAEDAALERRLAAELSEVERVKLLSAADQREASAAPAAPAPSTTSSAAHGAALGGAAVPVQRIKPSDNIAMRPLALRRVKDDEPANARADTTKPSKRKPKRGGGGGAGAGAQRVQSASDEFLNLL
jgi:hypothetical protein